MASQDEKVEALLGWIEINIPEDKWLESGYTLLRAAIYAMAVNEAEEMIEGLTVREAAELFVNGQKALDEEDLVNWIECWEDADDTDQEIPRALAQHLREFWGMDNRRKGE